MLKHHDSNVDISHRTVTPLLRPKQRLFGLRMTPMIDVIFLLLIFFVLTAKFRRPEDFLSLQLAGADTAVRKFAVIEPLILSISATASGCEVKISNCRAVPIAGLVPQEGLAVFSDRLREVLSSQKRVASDPIEISCSEDVQWDYLVKIYNVLHAMGINDITFNMTE